MALLWAIVFGPVAVLLAVMFYVPALLMAALARPLLGINPEDQGRIEELRKTCVGIWATALTFYLLLTR